MPIFRLGKDSEATILKAPESGMGYQVIWYRDELLVILNASLLLQLNELQSRRFDEDDYSLFSGDPNEGPIARLEPFEIRDNFVVAFSDLSGDQGSHVAGLGRSLRAASPPEWVISSKRPYPYYRFSAYWRDKRIAPNGDFLPGTYATTYNDMHFVPSGFAAVGRYALPNPASARHIFQIVTYDRPSLMGTATPNFGQAGGGVEVLFESAAKNRTGLSFMINAG